MNHYGTQALQHWKTRLPDRFSEIEDPTTHFTELGNQVADQVTQLSLQLAGPDPRDEPYLQKVGRLNAARQRAEELILPEEVLLAPDSTPAEPREQQTDWIPLVEDPQHPYWAAAAHSDHPDR